MTGTAQEVPMSATVLPFPTRTPEVDTDPHEPGPIAPLVALPRRRLVECHQDACHRAAA